MVALSGEAILWQCNELFIFFIFFLALLDFVSRATVVTQAAVVSLSAVRKLRFLRNRCIETSQTLWAALSPPYLQTFFFLSFFFSKFSIFKFLLFFSFFVNMGTYGSKTFRNATPPVFMRSEPNYMINKIGMGEYKDTDILAIFQN